MKIRSNYPAKKCRLDGIQFARYSPNPMVLMARHLDWWQIRRVHDIFARAENSGSEGYYVEIAKWHPKARQWQKFAFQKFLGGEVWRDLGARETAVRVAAMVNLAPYGPSLIHHPGRTRTYVMDGKRFQWRKSVSVVDVRQFEFTSIVHAMPTWGTLHNPATAHLVETLQAIANDCGEDNEDIGFKRLMQLRWAFKDAALAALAKFRKSA